MSDGRSRVMLDIETLGTEPGCAIVSVGAARWSIDGVGDERLYREVSLSSCGAAGLEIDPDTLSWWGERPASVRRALWGGEPLAAVLENLSDFCDGVDGGVWAKPPRFDIEILEAAYDAVDVGDPPWGHWEVCDMRALNSLVDEGAVEVSLEDADEAPDGPDHHALADARDQARRASAILAEVAADE